MTDQSLRRSSGQPRGVLLPLALVFTFCAGINAATHHWTDMACELVLVAFLLGLRAVRIEMAAGETP